MVYSVYNIHSFVCVCVCGGIFLPRKVKKGTLLIDSSTIDPAVSREMAVAAEKTGAVFMDAPVSGGRPTSGWKCLVQKISQNLQSHTFASVKRVNSPQI